MRAPTRPDFRTAAPREGRSGSPSPRSSPASARRAHTGSTPPHTHSHALHTHSVSGPTPVPRNRKLPAPGQGPTQFTRPQPLLRRPGTGHPRLGVTKAASPEGPPGRIPQHRADTARPAQTRGREEGAAPRLGLAPGIGYWGTPPHPSPPPFSAAQKVADGIAFPVQPTGRSRLRRLRRSWSRGAGDQGGRGAALRRRAPGRGRQPSQPGTLSSPTALRASYRPA